MDNFTPPRELMRRRLEDKLRCELGSEVRKALADPDVIEVMRNPDGQLWIDTFSNGMRPAGAMTATQAECLISTVATMLGVVVNTDRPILEAELPIDGSRITAVVAPIGSSPIIAIRKHASHILSLDDYVASNALSSACAAALRKSLSDRKNILIVGSAGSGKTTVANALLREISSQTDTSQRIVILEDTVELQCSAPNHLVLRTSDTADLLALLRTTMRLRPDRIIVGEVRGAEALTLLKAWNTGHPGGIATIHAGDCVGGLNRLDQLVQEANVPSQSRLIAETVQIVIRVARSGCIRRIEEVAEVAAWSQDAGFRLAEKSSVDV